MTEQPYYLITESELGTIIAIGKDVGYNQRLHVLEETIRSRPTTAPEVIFGCPYCERTFDKQIHVKIHCYADHQIKHDAAIAAQAREQLLKIIDLWRIKRMNGMLKKDVWKGWNDETDFIKSLRTKPQEQQEMSRR